MTRRVEVVEVISRVMQAGAPCARATATLASVQCDGCSLTIATVVRPWEVTGDVVDAMLRAAGWDPAHDLCPECQLDDRDDAVMRGQRTDGCPACARRCR